MEKWEVMVRNKAVAYAAKLARVKYIPSFTLASFAA